MNADTYVVVHPSHPAARLAPGRVVVDAELCAFRPIVFLDLSEMPMGSTKREALPTDEEDLEC